MNEIENTNYVTKLARAAYEAYRESVGSKSVHGEPLPQYADLPAALSKAWEAAVIAVVEVNEK